VAADKALGGIDVGTVIDGTYEVTGLIGRGGMGAVWAARHLRLPGKQVAIKVLLGGGAVDDAAYARFRREAEIASRLGHPNIVAVYDFNQLPSGEPYLVLEFLDGESLAARLKRGPLAPEAALAVARQIGSALHAAHKHGVVHRDLKPDNVFLVPTEAGGVVGELVKVLDFGISKIQNSQTVQTQESALLGTPQYMSPEQAHGRNSAIDARTDVFALGAIVYEMIAGRPAFGGATLAEVVLRIVHEPSPSLRGLGGVSARVAAAVDKALAKPPEARFADVDGFIAELTGAPLQTLDRRAAASSAALAATVDASAPASGGSLALADTGVGASVSSHAHGEVVPATADLRGRRRGVLVAVAAGVALGGAFAALAVLRRPAKTDIVSPEIKIETPPPRRESPETIIAQNTARNDIPAAAAGAVPAAAPVPVAAPAAVPVAAAAPAAASAPAHAAARPVAESLAPATAAELDQAEAALRDGQPQEAVRLARHSLLAQKSSRAYSVITRAYCRAGDLGNANASFLSVRGAERAHVLRECKSAGLELH
jgi:serine/threonine-protein kinase